MKALSLHQPWATLMALHIKTIETRGWQTKYRGPLAIHAAKRVVAWEELSPFLRDYIVELDAPMPLGAIVAVVELYDCLGVATLTAKYPDLIQHEQAFGNFTPGRFGW